MNTPTDTKPCKHCGKSMTKGKMKPSEWMRRTFCSFQCSVDWQKLTHRVGYGKNAKPYPTKSRPPP